MIQISDNEWRLARRLALRAKRYYPVDPEDVEQELLLWMLEHESEVRKWRDDAKWGNWNLGRALWRRARQIGETERATQRGYRPEDLYYYSKRQLRALLPYAIFDRPRGGREIESVSGSKDYDDALVMVIDVRSALRRLDEYARSILVEATDADFDYEMLGMEQGTSSEGARKKIERALGKLQKELGGSQPFDHAPAKKVIGNRQAIAIIQKQENGD